MSPLIWIAIVIAIIVIVNPGLRTYTLNIFKNRTNNIPTMNGSNVKKYSTPVIVSVCVVAFLVAIWVLLFTDLVFVDTFDANATTALSYIATVIVVLVVLYTVAIWLWKSDSEAAFVWGKRFGIAGIALAFLLVIFQDAFWEILQIVSDWKNQTAEILVRTLRGEADPGDLNLTWPSGSGGSASNFLESVPDEVWWLVFAALLLLAVISLFKRRRVQRQEVELTHLTKPTTSSSALPFFLLYFVIGGLVIFSGFHLLQEAPAWLPSEFATYHKFWGLVLGLIGIVIIAVPFGWAGGLTIMTVVMGGIFVHESGIVDLTAFFASL